MLSRLPAVASLGRVATVVTNPLKVFAVNVYALARPSTARPIEGELFRRDPAEPLACRGRERLTRIFHQRLGKSGAEPAKKRGPSELHSASWGLATNSL